jgi:hypothetical protein
VIIHSLQVLTKSVQGSGSEVKKEFRLSSKYGKELVG